MYHYSNEINCNFACCRYTEEHVQKIGVAIETQGFIIVTSGKKRESLMVWVFTLFLAYSAPTFAAMIK
jgi:hypothetical protein